MKISIKGVSDIQRKVSMWEVKRKYQVQQLIVTTAREIRKEARRGAPKNTGRLRKSIVARFNKDKTAGYVRAVAPYSHIVENGSASKNIKPKPFMQPAADKIKPKYVQKLKEIFGEAP